MTAISTGTATGCARGRRDACLAPRLRRTSAAGTRWPASARLPRPPRPARRRADPCHRRPPPRTRARPVRAVLFDKRAATNWAPGWHQDRTIAVRARRRRRLRSIKQGIVHVEPPFAVTAAMLTLRVHPDDMPDDNAPLLIAPARTGWSGSPGGSGRRHRRTLRHGRLRGRGGRHLVLRHRYPPCVRRGAWPSPPPRVAGRLCR